MSRILVVDQQRRPLMPCTPARARLLLKRGKAAILRRFPMVLILKEARSEAIVEPLRVTRVVSARPATGLPAGKTGAGRQAGLLHRYSAGCCTCSPGSSASRAGVQWARFRKS